MSIRNVVIGEHSFLLTGSDRYAAVYMRYYVGYADADYETPEDAAGLLESGEEYGTLSSVGIYDVQEERFLAQRQDESREGYAGRFPDWIKAVAIEVPVTIVDGETQENDGE